MENGINPKWWSGIIRSASQLRKIEWHTVGAKGNDLNIKAFWEAIRKRWWNIQILLLLLGCKNQLWIKECSID